MCLSPTSRRRERGDGSGSLGGACRERLESITPPLSLPSPGSLNIWPKSTQACSCLTPSLHSNPKEIGHLDGREDRGWWVQNTAECQSCRSDSATCGWWDPLGIPGDLLGSSRNLPAPVGFTELTCPILLDFMSSQGSWMSQGPACARKRCGKQHLNPHCSP